MCPTLLQAEGTMLLNPVPWTPAFRVTIFGVRGREDIRCSDLWGVGPGEVYC